LSRIILIGRLSPTGAALLALARFLQTNRIAKETLLGYVSSQEIR
jgi:hypothetical protein